MAATLTAGRHSRVRDSSRVREFFVCEDCDLSASSLEDLAQFKCNPGCENCNNLRHSHSERPAVPVGGDCNTKLHTCPNDGVHWFQSNTYYHLWQSVTNEKEWEGWKKQIQIYGTEF